MNYVNIIEKTLRKTFEPVFLEVIDESEQHRGHVGFKDGTQTHFKIVISAKEYLRQGLFAQIVKVWRFSTSLV